MKEADALDTRTMHDSVSDLLILKMFRVPIKPVKAPKIIEIRWVPPPLNWLKVNIDSAANESPGMAGCGGMFRTYN